MANHANTTRRALLKSIPACGMAVIVPAAAGAAVTVTAPIVVEARELSRRERLDAAIAELKTAAEAIWPTANEWMIRIEASPSVPVLISSYDPNWRTRS